MGTLYVVATPIGNKADFTLRAIEVLKKVDLIACEDCRTSAKLLDSYDIKTPLVSYHKFNEKQRTQEIKRILEEGKNIALISDAGTPCVSDPGRILVEELHNSDADVKITSVPGASAITALLSVVPRRGEEFAFLGFLPRVKNQQEQLFRKYINFNTVFYESANRLIASLQNLADARGENTKIAIGRELTKMYEEIKTGSVKELIEYFNTHTLKGEIAGMIYAQEEDSENDAEIAEKIYTLKKLGFSAKDISSILSALFNVNKNQVYKLAITDKN